MTSSSQVKLLIQLFYSDWSPLLLSFVTRVMQSINLILTFHPILIHPGQVTKTRQWQSSFLKRSTIFSSPLSLLSLTHPDEHSIQGPVKQRNEQRGKKNRQEGNNADKRCPRRVQLQNILALLAQSKVDQGTSTFLLLLSPRFNSFVTNGQWRARHS